MYLLLYSECVLQYKSSTVNVSISRCVTSYCRDLKHLSGFRDCYKKGLTKQTVRQGPVRLGVIQGNRPSYRTFPLVVTFAGESERQRTLTSPHTTGLFNNASVFLGTALHHGVGKGVSLGFLDTHAKTSRSGSSRDILHNLQGTSTLTHKMTP